MAPSYIYSIIELVLFFNLLFTVICMGISLACMSVHHMCTVPMEARRACVWSPGTTVNWHVGAENHSWVLRKRASALNHWSIYCSNPRTFILDSWFRYQLPTLCTANMFLYEHMYHSSYKKTIGCPSETDNAHANYLVKTSTLSYKRLPLKYALSKTTAKKRVQGIYS